MSPSQFERAKTMMPGTTEVVKAGDTLYVTDSQGDQLGFEGRESDEAMAFFTAFDRWWFAKKSGVESGVSLDALWYTVEQAWGNLPMHIIREMPSFRQLGASSS